MLGTKEQRTEGMKRQSQELIDHAYDRGFKAGYDKAFATLNENWQLVTSEAEEKGRNEGWEAAKKIMRMDLVERTKIFAEIGRSTYSVYIDMSASEAIEKLRAYEEQKKQEEDSEICVGDEVYLLDENYHSVVTSIYDSLGIKKAVCITQNGKCDVNDIDNIHKTGRTFPEIVEVLKKMQEGKDE